MGAATTAEPSRVDVAQRQVTAAQAKALGEAEQRVAAARLALEHAETERDKIRQRVRPRLQLGERVEIAGWRIKVSKSTSGPSFRVAKFLEKHEITKAMKPFFSRGKPYEKWTVSKVPDA